MVITPWKSQLDSFISSQDIQRFAESQSIWMDLNKKSKSKQKTNVGIQDNHEWKFPKVGHSNKIFQSIFGLVLQPIFGH